MNNVDISSQIRLDAENNVIYITFTGHISKTEMSDILERVTSLCRNTKREVNALHNLTRVSHITIEAQILFAQHALSPTYRKHALVSADTRIQESIDVIISIAEDRNDIMKVFSDEQMALEWLIGT